jgi:hypothetical protein
VSLRTTHVLAEEEMKEPRARSNPDTTYPLGDLGLIPYVFLYKVRIITSHSVVLRNNDIINEVQLTRLPSPKDEHILYLPAFLLAFEPLFRHFILLPHISVWVG